MHRAIIAAGLTLLATYAAAQQAAPAFDVASIKPNKTGAGGGEGVRREKIDVTPDSLTMRNVSIRSAIGWAYNVKNFQISGPDWMGYTRFDVSAKAAGPASQDQMRLMLRSLLAERFGLKLHNETKQLLVYSLLVAKGGPKCKESKVQGEVPPSPNAAGIVRAQGIALAQVVDVLAQALNAPVIDRTGLKGRYDCTVDVSAYRPQEGQQMDPVSMIIGALGDVGMKLESKKSPVDMVIVDHVEKQPSGN